MRRIPSSSQPRKKASESGVGWRDADTPMGPPVPWCTELIPFEVLAAPEVRQQCFVVPGGRVRLAARQALPSVVARTVAAAIDHRVDRRASAHEPCRRARRSGARRALLAARSNLASNIAPAGAAKPTARAAERRAGVGRGRRTSRSATLAPEAARRQATTHPAVPAPTTM